MKSRLQLASLALAALVVISETTYGMGAIRAALTNHVYAPPPAVTNVPPDPPAPEPPKAEGTQGTSGTQGTGAVVTASGPTLVKVWAQKNKVLGFKVTGLDGWPVKKGEKTIIGIMRCNGKKFDFVSTANAAGGGKVVDNLYGAEYGQSIKKGQTVMIDICDLNKKQATNPLPFVWPWEDTGR